MPVSLIEWRVRIGRFFQNPPDINKLEMIQRFLERWKAKKEKTAASPQANQDQTPSESAKEDGLKTAASPQVTQEKAPGQSVKKDNLKTAASPPTQDQTPCQSAKKGSLKTAASPPSPQDRTLCQSAKKGNLKTAASPPSTQDQILCQSAKKNNLKTASPASPQDQILCQSAKKDSLKTAASQPSPQDQTLCQSAKKDNLKTAASLPPPQDQTPCHSAKKEKSRMAACPPSTQTPCTPSCTTQTNLVPSSADTGPVVMSSITQVILMLLTLMTACFQWCRKRCSSLIFDQFDSQAETAQPSKTKDSLTWTSYFSSGLHFFGRMMCNALGGFCHLYLARIVLMRSGDVETNPGPERTVREEEFIKLSKLIGPSYYGELGVYLEINHAELDQIIAEHRSNYSDAFMTVFTRWRNKQQPGTDIRALLAERLERSGLGGLSGELLAGSLVPNWTGAPIKTPGSETEPLSPELVKQCAEDFKLKYRTTLCKIRADPLDPDSLVQFEDMYTNLFLEKEDRKRNQPLKYEDLFKLKVNGEFPRRLVVQGEAGAGKTTFCAKIAWDWINGSSVLPPYVWTIIVPLREAEEYTIGEIAKSYLTKENPATAHQITEYIRSHQKEVFIAFDGLDEFGGKLVEQGKDSSKSPSQCTPSPSTDQRQLPSLPSAGASVLPGISTAEACGSPSKRGAITSILRSDELAACPVLITSRPWKVSEIRWDNNLRKLYTFLHVEGFNKENVKVYIHKYFKNDEAKADQLIQLIHGNDIISGNMAPYPIYIAMLCLMWRGLDDNKREKFKSFQTFPQIFEEMFAFLKVHHVQKVITDLGSPAFTDYRKEIERLMQPVAKLAFSGLQKNTLLFQEKDFQHCSESMESACRVGVLSQEKRLISIHDKSNEYLQSAFFFPHKLFQEYMAGVHFASLYESDRPEFNRLLEEVVLPRKKEFRYLLYFAVSRNTDIAKHVMECLMQDNAEMEKDMDLLVDVAYESQDQDVADLLRDRVSSKKMELAMNIKTAHTAAGYIFTGIYVYADSLTCSFQKCGPTMSHDVAEMICSSPSLQMVYLSQMSFHDDFFAVLAKEGKKSKVCQLFLQDIKCPTPASSQNLVEALCSMPNLTDLTLLGMDPSEEFYSTLNANASALHVQTLDISRPTPASSQNLVEALCSMPNLNNLKLNSMDLIEEFCSVLNAKSSTLQVKSIRFNGIKCQTPAASQNLAEALCFMPNLTDLKLESLFGKVDLHEDFYFTLNTVSSSMQVKSIRLENIKCSTPEASQNLARALCSMPNLTDLTLSSGEDMLYPKDRLELHEEFYITLKAMASLQGCFPHISRGDFKFNGILQKNLDSFLHSLADFQRKCPPIRTSQPSAHSQQQPMGDVQPSDHSQQQPMGDVQPSDHSQQQPMRDVHPSDHSQQQPMGDVQPSDHSPQQPMGDVQLSYHSQQQPMGDVQLSYHRQQQPMRDVQPSEHSQQQPMGVVQPSYHSQQQPMGDVHPSDHSQQQPMGDVQQSDLSRQQPMGDVQPSDHSQQQPVDDVYSSYQVHHPRRTPQRLDQSHQQTILGTIPQGTKDQFFQSSSGGCSSSSKSLKRQAPCTQTTASKDTPAIPKKQARSPSLVEVKCLKPVSSQNLAEALCSMPNQNDLTLDGTDASEEFYSTLKANASTLQVCSLHLYRFKCLTPASSQNLVEALCFMPNLNDLTLYGMDLSEEFCSTLKAKVSALKVKSISLHGIKCPTPAASWNLAGALCFMPNLTDLELKPFRGEIDLHEEFCFTLNTMVSSMQGCFPHISKGDFKFNGILQENLDSFLHSLADFQRFRHFPYMEEEEKGFIESGDKKKMDYRHPVGEGSKTSHEGNKVEDDPKEHAEKHPKQSEEKSDDVRVNEESIKAMKDGNHMEGLFDHQGGELCVETHGCILHIPSGALEGESPTKITLEVLTELPDHIKLEEDEMVVSPGFKCLPSGLHFKKPVKLIMPHCAILIDSRKVKTVLHSWSHHTTGMTGKAERIPQTPTTCQVHQSHFELMLEHFSEGWLTMVWDWLSGRGKLMCCMPYLPNTMPPNRKPLMELRLQNKHSHALKGDHFQPASDVDDEIMIERQDLTVTCDHAEEGHETEVIKQRDLFRKTMCKVYFNLDLRHVQENTTVALELTQTDVQKILFDTVCMAPFQPDRRRLLCQASTVEEEEFLKLADNIDPSLYLDVGTKLGICHAQLNDIKQQHHTTRDALMEVFISWRNKQDQYTDIRSSLSDKLKELGLQELSMKLHSGSLLTS